MAYKKEESVEQAPESSSSSGSSSQQSSQAPSRSSDGGSRDSSAHAAASADRAAAANRGPVTKYTPSHRGGSESGSGTDQAVSPAWVGKNPYEWGNTTRVVNHWDDKDPERQAKLNALGFAADDPDRSFHFYEPDKGADKSYYDRAMSLSSDRNYFQAGNFWNTINGQYASEEDRVSDAMTWMTDAQIYGKWAKDHDLRYTDENGEEHSMEEAWKEIWSYANDIAGGIGDSESTRAQKEIQTYLTGGEYSSDATKEMLAKAKQFGEGAETEKDAKLWADLEKSLNIQLKDDEKREKREGTFLGKASDFFAAPEKEQVEYTPEETAERDRLQAEYDEAVRQRQEAEVNITDPWDYTLFVQPLKDREAKLEAQLKEMNRSHGQKVYEGLEDAAQARDLFEGWYGGRVGKIAANAGAMLGGLGANFHGMGYVDETHRELTMQFQQAQAKALATLDPEDRAEADRLEEELKQYENEHVEDNALERAGSTLINGAKDVVETAGAQTQEATEDMSDAGKMAVQIGMVGADVVLDMVESFAMPIPSKVIPGAGAVNMYARAGGANALDKLDAEGGNTNDYDRVALASVAGKLSAFLSEKTFGTLEGAYGGSFFGDLTDKLISKCSPFVQRGLKAVMNTEWGEEGLENFLNYLGDYMLDLNPNADLDTQSLQQDMAVGYGFGVIFNLLTHGVSISPNQMKSIAAESGEAGVAMAAGTPYSEIADIARETAKKDVTMNPQPAPAQAPVQAPASSGPTANNTPYEGPQLPGGQYGGGGSVKIGKDRVPFHYAVIPASELIPSHGVDGTPNPNYPSELQPRDRTRETSQAQVRDIGAALNPEELEWSGTASTGAPVVRSDGVVISGNGRTSGIAYSQQIGRNAEYMQYIRDNAPRFGIDPATIQDGSVLVRVVDGEDHDWAKLAAGGNDSGVAKYSASESATADAKRLTSEGVSGILDLLNPEADGVTDSRNDAFVRAFIRDVVPESEWGSMYTTKKNDQGVNVTVPSSDAYRRARNALFQAAYGDTALLARVSEGDDGSRVVNALVGIAPKLLNVENGAANGSLGNYELRDHILSAFNLFQDARAAGQSVAEMTANMSMFSEADADTIYLARFFEEQRNATNRMSWFLNGMCDRIMQHGAPESADSFGGFGLFEEGAEDTFGFGDVIEGGRENYAAEGKQPLPERGVWGRGSYEELADVAGLNQKERGEYYRDPDRARTSPTDSGYAGGSESVTAGEADAGSPGRDGQQGADAGSGANEGLSEETGKVRKEVLRSFTQKGIERTFKRGDMEIAKGAVKAQNPQEYIDYNAKSNAQRVRLTKWLAAVHGNPALLLAESDADRAVMLQMAMSDEWMYDSDAVLFRLMADRPADGGQDQFKLTEWAEKNGITDPEDVEYLRSKLHGLSANYPGLLNYSNSLNFDSVTLRSIDDMQDTLEAIARRRVGAAEPEASPVSENPLADIAEESAQPASAAQPDETIVDNLLGEKPEPATKPATEAQENPFDVNSQTEETNASEGVLNAQETEESGNPFFETEETAEPEPRNVNENVDTQREAVQNRREKISQYFSNTLTESGRAKGLDPITYNPTSEAESLTNAAMRLSQDKQAVLDQLMSSPAWNGELVDAAWMLENEFYKEFVATGDHTNWDTWRRLETYKISETAKGLQAVAKQSRPGAAGVLEASMNLLDDFRKGGKKESQNVNEADVKQAEKNVGEVTRRMAEIENEIDERVMNGMNEAEAKAMSKEAYLDLAEKINKVRNTGKMFFGKKGKFRRMLGNEDMDFIQRFVACQAAGIAEDVNYKGKQDRLKQANTFQKLAQLTGTGTWSRNLQGNTTFGIIDLLANDGVAVAVDQIVGKITGQRSTGLETGMLSRDARAAAKRTLNRSILEVAANIDLAENSALEGYDMSRTRTFDPNGNLVERVLSRWEQWNGYMLNSSDKFFRGGTEESVTRAIARANGWDVNNLTAEQRAQIRETAQQVADYRLFQNSGVAAEAADSIREGLNKLGAKAVGRKYEKGQFGLGTALTPYTKVPTNIGVKALEFSPAGAVKGFAEILRTASDAKAGKATMAQQNQAVTDFARGVTGTALIVGLAQLMKSWPFFRDWENEDDKDVLAQNRAEGKSGMQFNIDMLLRGMNGDKDTTWRNGDRTIDISSIEPANQLLTAASLISEGMPAGQAIAQSAKENFMQLPSVSALKNIEDTIRYTDTPDDIGQTLLNTAASTAGSVASGFIPAPIRHGTTVADEYARDTSGDNAAERAVNQFKASVPGLRGTLPVKTDNYGNEITSGDLGTRLLNTYGGNRYTQINQGDVSREAERLREATGEKLTPGRNGPSSEKFGDEKVKLTAEERKDWKDDYGQDLTDTVDMLMRSSIYKDADDDLKAQLWQNVEGYVRDGVKREFAEDHDLKHDSKYAYLDDVDNPVTFLTAKKAFDIAEENGDWDVVDTLVGPVGKLSQSEQDLMREKNRTLMSYYDYLTPNARGNKVRSAAEVHSYKEAASANAKARGVTSASGMDKYSAVVSGYRDKKYTDDDVDAFMTKQASDGDWEVTKGRAALYIAAREGGASVREAFDIIDSADVDQNGTIDEKGYTQKAMHEGTNALKRAGVNDQGAMWRAWDEIMYPYKLK